MQGATYSYFRYQLHHAVENALTVHAEVAEDFYRRWGRRYGALETYQTDDADTLLVMAGSFATKGKAAVQRWRQQGRRVGLVRLRLVRPLPAQELATVLGGRRAVAVLDQSLSPGLGGILYHELAAVLATSPQRPQVLRSFIGGLGGKDITAAEFDHVLARLDAAGNEAVPYFGQPELLFTEGDRNQTQQNLSLAGKLPTGGSP